MSRREQVRALLDQVERTAVTVDDLGIDAARLCALAAYNDLHQRDASVRFAAPGKVSQEFLDRVTVNFLRHEHTRYDEHLKVIARKVGSQQAYALLKNKVLHRISQVYPELHDECVRQRVEIADVIARLKPR